MEIVNRWELINGLFDERAAPTTYLEIGVFAGSNLRRVRADNRWAVDPAFRSRRLRYRARTSPARVRLGQRRGLLPFSLTSDTFFDRYSATLRKVGVDVAFVDGLHTAEQAHRDIVNALAVLEPGGTVVVHDCNPQSAAAAERAPVGGMAWNGDVYKAIIRLRVERDDLRVAVLDADHGLGIVRFGEPESRLDLDPDLIPTLSYEDLAADREHLLNLRPADAVSEYLG